MDWGEEPYLLLPSSLTLSQTVSSLVLCSFWEGTVVPLNKSTLIWFLNRDHTEWGDVPSWVSSFVIFTNMVGGYQMERG